jgi:hypothetical protein
VRFATEILLLPMIRTTQRAVVAALNDSDAGGAIARLCAQRAQSEELDTFSPTSRQMEARCRVRVRSSALPFTCKCVKK